jgi:hypothetical protein
MTEKKKRVPLKGKVSSHAICVECEEEIIQVGHVPVKKGMKDLHGDIQLN